MMVTTGRGKRELSHTVISTKKRKLEEGSLDDEDALGVVMEFLAPKELYRLAFTSKSLLQRVTTRMVVRSAMMSGGNAAKTINELHPLMKAGSISLPSPARLLRLVNGKTCEQACCMAKVNHVRPGYGVFLCWECTTQWYTKAFKTTWVRVGRNPRYGQVLKHERVTALKYGKNYYTWNRRLRKKDGEECGPLVTFNDIERIAGESPSKTVASMLSHLPPMKEYKEFLEAFDESTEEAKAAEEQRYEKKKAATKKASENRKTAGSGMARVRPEAPRNQPNWQATMPLFPISTLRRASEGLCDKS